MKNSFAFCDVEALAGNWTLAASQLGFRVVGRRALPGGFGNDCIDSNRPLLGDFLTETGPEGKWTPVQCHMVGGTPPCSGWSNLNMSSFRSTGRGADSDIHACTWDLIRFASRCTGSDGQPGPEFVCFESVQQAFTQGRPLMEKYFQYLNKSVGGSLSSGLAGKYELTHVLMSGASVGSACERRRYFWVAHRIPFGVDVFPVTDETPNRPVSVRDRLSPYERSRMEWPHVAPTSPNLRLIIDIMNRVGWVPGLTLRDACFQLLRVNQLPAMARRQWFDEDTCWKNFAGPRVIHPDQSAPVITGGSRADFLHYKHRRFLTVFELSRLMGLPDNWVIPGRSINKAIQWIGKNAPVESLSWLTRWVKNSLQGKPGPLTGSVVDTTYAWKSAKRIKVND